MNIENIERERERISKQLNGRYQIESVLGIGGMGTVYRVSDAQGKSFALKLIRSDLDLDPSSRDRFEQEIATLNKLSHRNIVRIYDGGTLSDSSIYIVMECLGGGSLREMLEDRGRIQLKESLAILHKLSLALDYAHYRGIVHRDLKPDNILFDLDGEPKLTDFGLAKNEDLGMSLTKTGETVGTPYYMAPEQFRAEPAAPSIDIYALGIIAYELIVGDKPFFHTNYIAVATMHLNYPIPKIPDVPTWYQELVESCCEKNPRHRFGSVRELAAALEYYMDSLGVVVEERLGTPVSESGSLWSKIKSGVKFRLK